MASRLKKGYHQIWEANSQPLGPIFQHFLTSWRQCSSIIVYCKGRMKLPLTPDGQWLRRVAKYSEGVTWRPGWEMNPPLNPPVPPSVPVVPLSSRPVVHANRHPGRSEVACCTPSLYWVWQCNFLPTKNGKEINQEEEKKKPLDKGYDWRKDK